MSILCNFSAEIDPELILEVHDALRTTTTLQMSRVVYLTEQEEASTTPGKKPAQKKESVRPLTI